MEKRQAFQSQIKIIQYEKIKKWKMTDQKQLFEKFSPKVNPVGVG